MSVRLVGSVHRRRLVAVAALVVTGFAVTGAAPAAHGGSSATVAAVPPTPTATSPATVTADALPTVQLNGVVWAQVTVGTIVYATGSFTAARPAGSRPGQNQVARANLLAYNITTGNLVTSFRHSLNAQGRAIAVSPDHRRLYVGGSFTRVDGVKHQRIAEFDLGARGVLVSAFAPTPNSTVETLVATNRTVYAGGTFTAVGSTPRGRLAAFSRSGSLLNWAPTAGNHAVAAMVLSPDRKKLFLGGSFTSVNGAASAGLGAVSPVTGRTVAWKAVGVVKDAGTQASITSLSTDGRSIFGTGYVYGGDGPTARKLEGAFSANPSTGAINFLEDCHGDTYDGLAVGPVFYVVSHEHDCATIGSFPETSPRSYHRATAFTAYATGTVAHNGAGDYSDWYGRPAPTQLNWYPSLTDGAYTGQHQAAWSITGNSRYIALGGEFPSVNGVGQQGLVRFAISGLAPNTVGPAYAAHLTPTVVSGVQGTVTVSWTQTADPDNTLLTYTVVRDSRVIAYRTAVDDTFYTERTMTVTMTGLAGGSRVTFRIDACDPFGNCTRSATTAVTIATNTPSPSSSPAPSPSPSATSSPPASPAGPASAS